MGKKIYKLLERKKILRLQDKIFPNIVGEITGETIRGSWWSHPLANPIYNGLGWLEHHHPILIVKLIDGKVTYLHDSLASDFFSIVCEPRQWQLEKLKADEVELFKYIYKKKKVTSEDLNLKKLAKDPKKSLSSLEKKLLLCASEEHTESGKHIKEYTSWKNSKYAACEIKDYLVAHKNITTLVEKLSRDSGAKVRLPW